MPTICTFRGIVIRMYFDDHTPPHFHAVHQGAEAKIEISTAKIIEGRLRPRALRHIRAWVELHRSELQENWSRAERHAPLMEISPLE
jgi:hypothetical protein